MPSRWSIPLALWFLFAASLSGCLNPGVAVIKPTSVRGTWTGTLALMDLYGKDYREIDAVALRADGGTPLPSPRLVDQPPVGVEVILVDRSRKVLRRDRFEVGTRVEVTGLMVIAWVKDRTGTRVTHEKGGPAWHYHSVNLERMRVLPALNAASP